MIYKHKNKILIDLDFLSLEISSQKILGVTGTEGKSSTCSYINQILSKKYKTKIIGNFGNTILDKTNLNKYLSKIDILINSAGITGPTTQLWNYKINDWKKIIEINLNGTFHCCKSIVPFMIKNKYG